MSGTSEGNKVFDMFDLMSTFIPFKGVKYFIYIPNLKFLRLFKTT